MDRLFIYGSLGPGGPNERIMNEIGGSWEPAVVKGRLLEEGWGASIGYPGLVLGDDGDDIRGHVFTSDNLEDKWVFLDEFEGNGYERVSVSVTLRGGERVQAYVYVLRAG